MKTFKKILLAALVLSAANASAQQPGNYTIKAKLSGQMVDSVKISYKDEKGYMTKTLPVVNQSFTFTGKTSGPSRVYMLFKKTGEIILPQFQMMRMLQLYAEPGELVLTGDPADLSTMAMTGSKTEKELEDLNARTAAPRKKLQPLLMVYLEEKNTDKKEALKEQMAPYQAEIEVIQRAFLKENPNAAASLDMMPGELTRMKLEDIKAYYASLNNASKASVQGREIAEKIKLIESASPGSVAPLFAKTDINGKTWSLSDFKGKYVMLDFWASWCVPCRAGNPHLITLYNAYKNRGLEIVGIADDDSKLDAWHAAIEKDGIGIWRHILRGYDKTFPRETPNPNDLDQLYNISSIPTKILIDPSGKIIGRFGSQGGTNEDMDKMLASIFNR